MTVSKVTSPITLHKPDEEFVLAWLQKPSNERHPLFRVTCESEKENKNGNKITFLFEFLPKKGRINVIESLSDTHQITKTVCYINYGSLEFGHDLQIMKQYHSYILAMTWKKHLAKPIVFDLIVEEYKPDKYLEGTWALRGLTGKVEAFEITKKNVSRLISFTNI